MPEINDVHADYSLRLIQWTRIRNAIEGEDSVKDQAETYLPKPSAMDTNEYNAYKMRSSFFPIAERTLRGLGGMIFRHPAKVELPSQLEGMKDNLTNSNESFNILVEEIVRETLSIGRSGLLLDYPEYTTTTELPYIGFYEAEDIKNWREEWVNGRKQLVWLVLGDDIEGQTGDDVTRYLELRLDEGVYGVRKWESNVPHMNADGTRAVGGFSMVGEVVPLINGKPLDYIPFVFVNPYNLRAEVDKPPFQDIVSMNMAHYRNSADYEHALYLTAQPTPVIAGNVTDDKKPKAIGSGTIWILPEGATANFLEFKGTGIQSTRDAMGDKEARMAALGVRMINEGMNRNEAPETAKLRTRGEMSLLSSVVNITNEAFKQIFTWAAEWQGANPDDVLVELNRDFIEARMEPEAINALVKAVQGGAISHVTFWENMQTGEIGNVDRTADEEKDLIESEGMMLEALMEVEAADKDRDAAAKASEDAAKAAKAVAAAQPAPTAPEAKEEEV